MAKEPVAEIVVLARPLLWCPTSGVMTDSDNFQKLFGNWPSEERDALQTAAAKRQDIQKALGDDKVQAKDRLALFPEYLSAVSAVEGIASRAGNVKSTGKKIGWKGYAFDTKATSHAWTGGDLSREKTRVHFETGIQYLIAADSAFRSAVAGGFASAEPLTAAREFEARAAGVFQVLAKRAGRQGASIDFGIGVLTSLQHICQGHLCAMETTAAEGRELPSKLAETAAVAGAQYKLAWLALERSGVATLPPAFTNQVHGLCKFWRGAAALFIALDELVSAPVTSLSLLRWASVKMTKAKSLLAQSRPLCAIVEALREKIAVVEPKWTAMARDLPLLGAGDCKSLVTKALPWELPDWSLPIAYNLAG
jgi:hypothetical protein